MDIYVGNLAYEVRDDDLQTAFAAFGEVESARVIMDRESGRSRGFGFVKMPNNDEGQAAIDALNDSEMQGRPIRVREAEQREERPQRSGGGGGGGGGGGFNRGGGNRGGGRGGDRGGDRGGRGGFGGGRGERPRYR